MGWLRTHKATSTWLTPSTNPACAVNRWWFTMHPANSWAHSVKNFAEALTALLPRLSGSDLYRAWANAPVERLFGKTHDEVLGSNNQGGLSAIVAKLQQSGFGDQVKSWLGNGQNLPITAEQLQQVLGSDTVKQLAARFNIPVDQLAQVLAEQLPRAVDHASPDGKLPHKA